MKIILIGILLVLIGVGYFGKNKFRETVHFHTVHYYVYKEFEPIFTKISKGILTFISGFFYLFFKNPIIKIILLLIINAGLLRYLLHPEKKWPLYIVSAVLIIGFLIYSIIFIISVIKGIDVKDIFEEAKNEKSKFNYNGYDYDYRKYQKTYQFNRGFNDGASQTISIEKDNIFAGMSKLEAKHYKKQLLKKIHPDAGGDLKEAQAINEQFDQLFK